MRKPITVACVAVALFALVTAPAAAKDSKVVRTDKGLVKGTVTSTVRTFQAVPFAAPPVGPNRWRDPQPAQAWTGVRDATKPIPSCAQTAGLGQPAGGTEDCLYLNVTTPAKPSRKPRPVMVWIHGGGFTSGSAGLYNGEKIAVGGDAVVVTINYRLGAFGFFGYPGLPGSGAFGLADQQEALKWVRRNASAFGGDPRNVTIFGESAGGLSVCAQLTTPAARGLFHKAIIQSGPCQLSVPAEQQGVFTTLWRSREDTERAGVAAKPGGCADLACLRALPTQTLLSVHEQFAAPSFHTRALPTDPVKALREGRFQRVPTLVGSTHDEMTLYIGLGYPQPIPDAEYPARLTQLFGPELAPRVQARYPLDGDGDLRPEIARLLTDKGWACTSHEARQQLGGVFGYEFSDPNPPMLFPGLPPFPYKAYHASELTMLFDFGLPLTAEQKKVSEYMVAAWGRFAHRGDPGWRRSDVQSLAPGAIGPVDFAREHQCGFWATAR